MPRHRVALCLLALLLPACTATQIGGVGRSPDNAWSLRITSTGSLGQPYYALGNKQVHLAIYREPYANQVLLFSQNYTIRASKLEWNIHWTSPDEVTVEFFDFGPNVSSATAHDTGIAPQPILTKKYHRPPRTEFFQEVDLQKPQTLSAPHPNPQKP